MQTSNPTNMVQLPHSDTQNIPLHLVDEPTGPMRSGMDLDGIHELAESIRTVGLINPITVMPRGDRFEVVAGHRRLLALRLVGVEYAPCIVRELDVDGVVAVMATENLERSDVDPVDQALLIGRAVGEDESKIPALAKALNRSVGWVRSRLDLLGYDADLITAIRAGSISLGVAALIAQVEDDEWRQMFTKDAASHGWTQLQAEIQVNLWKSGALDGRSEVPPAPDGSEVREEPKARAMCARCGRMAVHPNLHSVFVHMECPLDEAPATS